MMATPWRPMGPDRITTSPGRARSAAGDTPVGHDADARGVHEQAVRGAATDDLGVARDDLHAGALGGRAATDSVIERSSENGSPSSMM